LRNYYTSKEKKELLESMVIIIDSAEKKIDHILKYFKSHHVNYKVRKLAYGDYSYYLPKNPEMGISKDLWADDEVVVERKAHLSELARNFSGGRERFEHELFRSRTTRFYLMIEDGTMDKIVRNDYKGDYTVESYIATLFTFQSRYNFSFDFLDKKYAGLFILRTMKYHLREKLKCYSDVE